jgi:1-acyl-sn-glycerol-3-phosphate acyltransferase
MPRLRAILLLGVWFTIIALLGPLLILLTILTRKEGFIYTPVRFFVRTGLAMAGVRVEVEGLDRLRPNQTYLFTPNHQSFIEVPLLVTYLKRNIGFLAKKELFKFPIFGYGIRVIGVVPVDRSNTAVAIQSAQLATERLRSGKSYAVYPEGTRSPDGRVLPFKKGAFLMAIDAGVPIVPISISGSTAVMPKGRLALHPGVIKVVVHEPITPSGYSKDNVDALMSLVRSSILSSLNEQELSVS